MRTFKPAANYEYFILLSGVLCESANQQNNHFICVFVLLGDSNCFLFSVTPALDIFQVTDYNSHFMYLNQGQETLPNGLVSKWYSESKKH